MGVKVNKEQESKFKKELIKNLGLEDLLKENATLKNRCKALTKGCLCAMCSFDCENRAQQQLKRGGQNE